MQLSTAQITRLKCTSAEAGLDDCTRVCIFDADLNVLYSTVDMESSNELESFVLAMGSREAAVRRGLMLQGQRYEVHRHHPPLVWGRIHSTDPEHNTGIAVCQISASSSSRTLYAIITYELPHVSARMVDLLRIWCSKEGTALAAALVPA